MKRKALWTVCIAMCAAFAANAMVVPLVPLMGFALGASPGLVGLLVSAAALLPLLLAIPVGRLVDSLGPKLVLVAGSLGIAIPPLFVAAFPSLLVLGLAQIFIGLFHLVLIVAAQTYVASLGSGKTTESNFGLYSTLVSLGQLLGPVVAGVVADSVGFAVAFLSSGLVALIALVLTPLLDVHTIPVATRLEPVLQLRSLIGLARLREVTLAMVVSTSIVLVNGVYQAFFPVYLDALAYPATLIGVLFSARALASVVVRPFTPLIVSLFNGRARTFFVTLLLAGIALVMTATSTVLLPLSVSAVLLGMAVGLALPLSIITTVDQVQPHARGVVLGIRLTGNYMSLLAGPLILGAVADLFGIRTAFVITGCLVLPACLFLIRSRHSHFVPMREK